MKKIILSFISAVALTFTAQADVITVSNNVYSPGQYTNLQEAVDASQPYDTILVAGSTTSYGHVTIKWPLTLFGAGYNNPYGENTIVDGIALVRQNVSIGANDVKISGFDIQSYLVFNPYFSGGNISAEILENVVIERCQIRDVRFAPSGSREGIYRDITFRNNVFKNGRIFGDLYTSNTVFHNIELENNIFDNYNFGFDKSVYNTQVAFLDFRLRNNLFLNSTNKLVNYTLATNSSSPTYSFLDGLTFENNIFYGVKPEGCVNCSFNNNITYLCNNDDLLSGTNPGSVGGNNIIGQDPKFVNYPVLGGAFDYAHDYHLKPSSPAVGTATNGGDMGIYGGTMPFHQLGKNPNIPQMMWVDFPGNSSVPVGGTLNVDFKSHKQD